MSQAHSAGRDIEIKVSGGVQTVRFQRADKKNAFTKPIARQLACR